MGLVVGLPVLMALVVRLFNLAGASGLRVNNLAVDGPAIFGLMIWAFFVKFSVPVLGVFYGTSLVADEVEDKTITYQLHTIDHKYNFGETPEGSDVMWVITPRFTWSNDDQSTRCLLLLKTHNAYGRESFSFKPIEITCAYLVAFDLKTKQIVYQTNLGNIFSHPLKGYSAYRYPLNTLICLE